MTEQHTAKAASLASYRAALGMARTERLAGEFDCVPVSLADAAYFRAELLTLARAVAA